MNDYNIKKVVISSRYYKSEPRKIAGLFNGEISWQRRVLISQINSGKNWIKAFRKNKKKPTHRGLSTSVELMNITLNVVDAFKICKRIMSL